MACNTEVGPTSGLMILLLMILALHDMTFGEQIEGEGSEQSVTLTLSPTEITAGLTRNISLRCVKPRSSDTVWWLKIYKESPVGWRRVADISEHGGLSTTSETDAKSVKGDLNSTEGQNFLEVNWSIATQRIFGTYRCEVFGMSSHAGFFIDKSLDFIVNETLTSKTILHFWSLISIENDPVKLSVETSLEKNFIALKISEFGRLLEQYVLNTEMLQDEIESRVPTWRRGSFALPEPDTGCPSSYMDLTDEMYSLNDFSSQTMCWYQPFHLAETDKSIESDLNAEIENKCYQRIPLCKYDNDAEELSWPDGHYCIHRIKNKACPTGFLNGELVVSQSIQHDYYGYYYTGITESTHSIKYCCKNSGSQNTTMLLPKEKPFYLYRFGGTCQQVYGMDVLAEYVDLYVHAEDENSEMTLDLSYNHPDIDINPGNPTRIHLCYYSERK